MNTAVNVNVVHESEAQRQHARVKIPAVLRYLTKARERVEQPISDLSAGGFSFSAGKAPVRIGDYHKGRLQFQLESLDLGIDIEFQVRSVDPDSQRVGCQFHNLKPREQATLHQLISAYLSGELVGVGDLLNTLQRENFTKARKNGAGGAGMGVLARLKAVTFSLAVFLVGLAAFGFIFKSLYGLYFVTHAQSGLVSVPSLQVTMPREGTVNSLLGPDATVAKGAPIASFSASMLAENEAMGAPLATVASGPSRLLTVPSRGMVTCRLGTLTRPDWAWVTKYRPYSDLKIKPKAASPTRNTARLKVTALSRASTPMPAPPAPFLRALVKFSRCRVLSRSPTPTSSPLR